MAKEKTNIELTEVPVEMQTMFKLPDGNVVDMNQYLLWIGNTLQEIKEAVA